MKFRVERHAVTQPEDPKIRLIPLTQGQNVVVDAADYEYLCQWNWSAKRRQETFYAKRVEYSGGRKKTIYMHRVIVGGDHAATDHRNGDGLDNRRLNLRPGSHRANMNNRKNSKDRNPKYGSAWMLY